jgi:integrase
MSSSRIATYSRHASGQARVWIGGQHVYLGPFGSPQSKRKYREIVDRWQRQRDFSYRPDLTVGQLALLYDPHAREHYKKNGQASSEVHCIRAAIRFLLARERHTLASQFGPKKLKQIQRDIIEDGQCRRTINGHCERIRRLVAWGVSEELVAPDILTALRTVRGLGAGRTDAEDREPIGPVNLADVLKIRRHVSRQVMGMVLLQLRTGGRPGEVVQIRGDNLNTTGDVWVVVPQCHKTEHRGRSRTIFIGPRGQRIVRKFLTTDPGKVLFSPIDAEVERSQRRRAARRSPMTPSQAARGRAQDRDLGPPSPHFRRSSQSLRRSLTGCRVPGTGRWPAVCTPSGDRRYQPHFWFSPTRPPSSSPVGGREG